MVAQIAALAVLLWYRHGDLSAIVAAPYDGAIVTLSVFVLNPVSIAVLLLAVQFRDADPVEYLALVPPRLETATLGAIGILVIIAATDALLFVSGQAIVSSFQVVVLHHRRCRGLAAADVVCDRHRRPGGRRDHVSRLLVPRLGPFAARCMDRRSH